MDIRFVYRFLTLSYRRLFTTPTILQTDAVACALPIAYYGSEAWWPGRFRQGPRGRISNRVDSLLQLLDQQVEILWIPGHEGIEGNEKAVKLAKAALNDLPDERSETTLASNVNCRTKFTFASISRFVREHEDELVASWWQVHRPRYYADLGLNMTRKRPPELALPRWAYHRLLAARTGHGDFATYHERFKHENFEGKCDCGREKRPWHFAECRPVIQRWRNAKREARPRASEMLGEKGWKRFLEFVTITRCYGAQTLNHEV
ncbi:hypothetical protein K3495_g3967 [Podosphaera aphanis]|nr:hypothetical protein K3495_g3967 [Podosphaera aphanis]